MKQQHVLREQHQILATLICNSLDFKTKIKLNEQINVLRHRVQIMLDLVCFNLLSIASKYNKQMAALSFKCRFPL